MLIPLDRNGYLEDCYFSFSYSPIRDETGGVGGMLAVVAETTERVQGERRMVDAARSGRVGRGAQRDEDAASKRKRSCPRNPDDVPFALLYLLDATGGARGWLA